MLKQNFHTHTKRCGHAIGEDEDYVKEAIKAGVKILGFSDHAPYKKPWPTERMNYEQVDEYFSSIRSLKEQYKDQIEIHLGMEVEFYPSQWETLKKWREETEYCILGQHNLELDQYSSYTFQTPDMLQTYADRIAYACQHNLCDYIAHPDVCMWSYPRIDGDVRALAERIAEISHTYDVPVELNCGSGVKYGYQQYRDGSRYAYPVRAFFEEFAKQDCKIIIGLDIHDPKLFHTDEYINRALSVIEGLDCNIVDNYDLITEAAKRKKLFY